MRQGEQGRQIRDIISESEGERKGVRKQIVEQDVKVEEEEEVVQHEELVEEEIVGECELVSLGMEGICCDEPPDEIISSPISKLNIFRSDVNTVRVENVKAKLEDDFENKEESIKTDLPVPHLIPFPPPPKTSTPSPPNVQKYLNSTTTTNLSSGASKNPFSLNKSGIRKIKAEAFILNPLKSKSDFPQFRRLDSTPKGLHRNASTDGPSPPKLAKVSEQARKVANDTIDTVIQCNVDSQSQRPLDSHPASQVVRAESVIVKQEHGIERDRLSSDSMEGEMSPGESSRGKVKRKSGCRCGNATLCPGKLTCCGQRCPCYVDSQACMDCKCKGCRNPHRPGGGKVRPAMPTMQNTQVLYPAQGTSGQHDQMVYTNRLQSDKVVYQPARNFSDKVVYTARSPEKIVKTLSNKVVYPVKSFSDKVVYSTNRQKTESTTVRMPVNVGNTFSLKDLDLSQLPILNLDTMACSSNSHLSTISVPLSSVSTSTIKLNSPLMGGSTTSSFNPIRLQPRPSPSLGSGSGVRIQPVSVISVLGSPPPNRSLDTDSLRLLREEPTMSAMLPEEEDLDLDIDYA